MTVFITTPGPSVLAKNRPVERGESDKNKEIEFYDIFLRNKRGLRTIPIIRNTILHTHLR